MFTFKTKKRKAKEAAALTWRAPMLEALDATGRLSIVEAYRRNTIGNFKPQGEASPKEIEAFQSTAASQWSTAGSAPSPVKELSSPIRLLRDTSDNVIGITFNKGAAKSQIEHWKWLARDPKLVVQVIRNARHQNQNLLDSALFL